MALQVRDLQPLGKRQVPPRADCVMCVRGGLAAAPDVPAGAWVQIRDLTSLGVAVSLADQLPISGVSRLHDCSASRLKQRLRVAR